MSTPKDPHSPKADQKTLTTLLKTMYDKSAKGKYKAAKRAALEILSYSNGSVLDRANAHMYISCGDSDDCLWHAQEAIREIEAEIKARGRRPELMVMLKMVEGHIEYMDEVDEEEARKQDEEEEDVGVIVYKGRKAVGTITGTGKGRVEEADDLHQ